MDELGSASAHQFANVGDNGMVDYTAMNKGVTPIFFVEPIPDDKATEAAGAVRLREQEMVRIVVAGDMLNVATSPVTEELKVRFATQYDAWKTKRIDQHIEGTPLKNWPMIPAIRIAEFNAVGIFSVENLSDVSDGNIHKLSDGRVWREKAIAWLKSAKDNGAAAKYAAENERLRDEIGELSKKIDAMAAEQAAERRGPGRPRKDAA
jgi:hypothetical protein